MQFLCIEALHHPAYAWIGSGLTDGLFVTSRTVSEKLRLPTTRYLNAQTSLYYGNTTAQTRDGRNYACHISIYADNSNCINDTSIRN